MKNVLLVGSVPGKSVSDVFKTCCEGLPGLISAVPDGELDNRSRWVFYQATTVFDGNPDIETLVRPHPQPGQPGGAPSKYGEMWQFRVRPGAKKVHFPTLNYVSAAAKSYAEFKKLRAAGKVPKDVRFQVCLPFTESGWRFFWPKGDDFAVMTEAYRDAMRREVAELVKTIPAEDLLVQWDVCMEALAIECNDDLGHPPIAWSPGTDPFARYVEDVKFTASLVPANVPMGLHLCYGDLGHKHLIEPKSLDVCVRMANAATEAAGRAIDFFHMPVPRGRTDDAYFAPLKNLKTGKAKIYLGLVHHTDGVAGTRARLAAAQKYLADPGIATECGFGRRPEDQIPGLLAIHREIAATL